jgi:arylsulfatase A-like enzyme
MNRVALRWKIALLSSLGLMLGCYACSNDSSLPKPRHVVLIVVDTLRADHLSAYGYRRPTTPELDRLAAGGVLFERAISQGSWTIPSMVSMLTGAYIADELIAIPPDQTTLAQVFQQGGYRTAAFIYNDVLGADNGFQAGFELFDFQDPPYSPIDKIAAWIGANRGKRSFTFIHLNEAHDPYGPPGGTHDRFVREPDSIPAPRMEYFRAAARELQLADFDASVRTINDEIGGYDDDVRYSDEHIGKILAAIRASGEWDHTAIVVASDHGEGLWTRPLYMTGSRLKALTRGDAPTLLNTMHMTHGSQVNLELVHVPLILMAPGLPQGRRIEPWVENVDVAPTLLELCDLPRPPGLQGTSLLSLCREPRAIKHQKIGAFSHTRYVSSFIDQNGFQLLLPTARGECEFNLQVELYNLREDPEARTNLAEREPARVKALSAQIKERMAMGLEQPPEADAPSERLLSSLAGLGYLSSGVVDQLNERFAAMSIEELLAELANPKNINCLVRLEAARELSKRKLSAESQREAVVKLRASEVAPAIQQLYERLLLGN